MTDSVETIDLLSAVKSLLAACAHVRDAGCILRVRLECVIRDGKIKLTVLADEPGVHAFRD